MLTPEIKAYFKGMNGMGIGTVASDLRPEFQRALGAVVIDDDRIKLFVDKPSAGKTFDNLSDNGRLSVIMVSMTSMESFQFKGHCTQWHPISEEDHRIFEQYMKDFDLAAINFGMLAGGIYNYPHSDLVSLVVDVKEVFEQSPRAGTGRKIL